MHMSEATQIMEALSTNEVNVKLAEGWSLISIAVTTNPNGQLHPLLRSRQIETPIRR
jgi:hypothetical protein